MVSKTVLVLLVMEYIFAIIDGQQESEKFFRKDYKYFDITESFYKLHTLYRTWDGARTVCEREGAMLFYPEDEDEASIVLDHWNSTQPHIQWLFIGAAAMNVEEIFDTVDGKRLADVYNNWSYGEPNNAGGTEGCVVMRRDGTLNDDNCSKKAPFICKKTYATLYWNTDCGMHDPTYEFHTLMDRCYKFHLTPKNWSDAYAICAAELSYLAIINSEAEASLLANLTANANKDNVKGDYLRGAVHLGFKNKNGWVTTKGEIPLHESGYNSWGNGQPDGGDAEQCGSMFYSGQLNDIGCWQRMFFICEHEIQHKTEDITFRFGIN